MFSPNPTAQDIFLSRLFEEPLVPVGADPTPAENAALAAALQGYSKRSGPDDFSSLTGSLETYPQCPWNAALLTNLGLDYYHMGHYSKTLEIWTQAWHLARVATDPSFAEVNGLEAFKQLAPGFAASCPNGQFTVETTIKSGILPTRMDAALRSEPRERP
jgi:hypothetical protein